MYCCTFNHNGYARSTAVLLDRSDAGVKGTAREQNYFRILPCTPFQLPAGDGDPVVFKQTSRPAIKQWNFSLRTLLVRASPLAGRDGHLAAACPAGRAEHRARPWASLFHFHGRVLAKLIVGHGSFKLLIRVIEYY